MEPGDLSIIASPILGFTKILVYCVGTEVRKYCLGHDESSSPSLSRWATLLSAKAHRHLEGQAMLLPTLPGPRMTHACTPARLPDPGTHGSWMARTSPRQLDRQPCRGLSDASSWHPSRVWFKLK